MRQVGLITGGIELRLFSILEGEGELSDLNDRIKELAEDHDLQHGEVLALFFSWLKIHIPGDVLFHRRVLNYVYKQLKINFPSQAEEYIVGGQPDLEKIFGFGSGNERRKQRNKRKSSSIGISTGKEKRKLRSK